MCFPVNPTKLTTVGYKWLPGGSVSEAAAEYLVSEASIDRTTASVLPSSDQWVPYVASENPGVPTVSQGALRRKPMKTLFFSHIGMIYLPGFEFF